MGSGVEILAAPAETVRTLGIVEDTAPSQVARGACFSPPRATAPQILDNCLQTCSNVCTDGESYKCPAVGETTMDDYRVLEAWLIGWSAADTADELGLDPIIVADTFEAWELQG